MQLGPHLVGDDVRQGRLAQAGRAVEQDVVEHVATLPRGGDGHPQVLDQPGLADIVLVEGLRAQGSEFVAVLAPLLAADDALPGLVIM